MLAIRWMSIRPTHPARRRPATTSVPTPRDESKRGNSLADATAAPTGTIREVTQSLQRIAQNPLVQAAATVIVVVATDELNRTRSAGKIAPMVPRHRHPRGRQRDPAPTVRLLAVKRPMRMA